MIRGFSQKLTISSQKVASNLNNFPVYVNLADLSVDFFRNVKTDGGDIRVLLEDTDTEVPVEVVAIDTTAKTGELYFKADLSSTKDNVFYICYGDPSRNLPSRTSIYGSNNVWGSNAKYVGHLQANSNDSSVNSNNLTDINSPTYVDSKIYKGLNLEGGATNQYSRLDTGNPLVAKTNGCTISCWEYRPTGAGSGRVLNKVYGSTNGGRSGSLLRESAAYSFLIVKDDSPTNTGVTATSAINPTRDAWHLFHGTYDITTGDVKIYIDGVQSGATANNPDKNSAGSTARFQIGTEIDTGTPAYLLGKIDEVRVYDKPLTADEILTEYNNQSSPSTFYSLEDQTSFISTNILGSGSSAPQSREKDIYFKRNLDTRIKKKNEAERLKQELLRRTI